MEFDIKKNSAAEVSEKCTEDNTAIKLGSGKSPVYATPALVASWKTQPSTPAILSSRKAITPSASHERQTRRCHADWPYHHGQSDPRRTGPQKIDL